jgi:hypothetical protein
MLDMPLHDLSKECKHLRSMGEKEVYMPGSRRAKNVVDKGFKCDINKFGPHLCGPKRCDPKKRECFVERVEEEETAEETVSEPETSEEKPAE